MSSRAACASATSIVPSGSAVELNALLFPWATPGLHLKPACPACQIDDDEAAASGAGMMNLLHECDTAAVRSRHARYRAAPGTAVTGLEIGWSLAKTEQGPAGYPAYLPDGGNGGTGYEL